jgi:hypothetical protein
MTAAYADAAKDFQGPCHSPNSIAHFAPAVSEK